jgi:hypothetical protein
MAILVGNLVLGPRVVIASELIYLSTGRLPRSALSEGIFEVVRPPRIPARSRPWDGLLHGPPRRSLLDHRTFLTTGRNGLPCNINREFGM